MMSATCRRNAPTDNPDSAPQLSFQRHPTLTSQTRHPDEQQLMQYPVEYEPTVNSSASIVALPASHVPVRRKSQRIEAVREVRMRMAAAAAAAAASADDDDRSKQVGLRIPQQHCQGEYLYYLRAFSSTLACICLGVRFWLISCYLHVLVAPLLGVPLRESAARNPLYLLFLS